jgi:hypothetical protein
LGAGHTLAPLLNYVYKPPLTIERKYKMSIQEKAVLVSLNVSCWSGNKTDRAASQKLEQASKSQEGTFKAIKNLLPDQGKLKEIKSLVGSTRNTFYDKTLPWNRGQYIMPADIYEDWQASFNDQQEKFKVLVDDFVADYGRLKDIAKSALGDAYSSDDYPSDDVVKDLFTLEAHVEPIADNDWRVKISSEQKEMLQRDWQKHQDKQIKACTTELWERLDEYVKHYISQMEQGKRLHDSTVDQLADLVANVPSFNLASDKRIETARDAIKEALADLSMGEIKADKTNGTRKAQAEKMREAQDKMAGLMGGMNS